MTFKEFNEWCNRRACDGCWDMYTALYCSVIYSKINKLPFWKRKKAWDEVKDDIEKGVVQVIDEKIASTKKGEQR